MEKNEKKDKIKKESDLRKIKNGSDKDYEKLKKDYLKTKLALAQFTDAPIVQDMDDVPDDLPQRKFVAANRNDKTGAPQKLLSFPLGNVSVMYFGDKALFDKFIEREQEIRRRNTTEDLEKIANHQLSNPGSNRGQEMRSALGIFFRFVCTVIVPSVVDIRHLLDTRVAVAFPRWYESTGKKPSTISNVIKMLRMFLKYLHGLEQFANYRSRINAVDDALRIPGAKARDIAKSTANKTVAESMMLLGEWLDKDELRKLNELVCNRVTQLIDKDKLFISEKSSKPTLSRDESTDLMGHLFLLSLMHLGGQRRQFGASVTKKNVVFEGSEVKFFPPPEKVKRAKTDFFVLPATFGVPLRVWIDRYLPVLANKGVESVWINRDGNAMRYQGLSNLISSIVASYFPGRRITCTYFRRALVTFLTEHQLKYDEEGVAKFFSEKHAALINTSPAVLATHYDRLHRSDVNKGTLETVNNTVGMKPTKPMAQMLDKFQKQFDKKNDDFADSIVGIVNHKFVSRSSVEFTVAFKDGSQRDFPGHRMQPFMELVSAYWASIGGRASSGYSTPNRFLESEDDDKSSSEDDKSSSDEESSSWDTFEAVTSDEVDHFSASESDSSSDGDSGSRSLLSRSSSSSSSCAPSPSSSSSSSVASSSSSSSSKSKSAVSKSTNVNESFQVPSQTLPLSPLGGDHITTIVIDDADCEPKAVANKANLVKKTPKTAPPKRSTKLLGNSAKKTPKQSKSRRPPPKPARKGKCMSDSDDEGEKPLASIFRVNLFPSVERTAGEKRKISLSLAANKSESNTKKPKKM